jgi:type IV pilus assembly protein PilE
MSRQVAGFTLVEIMIVLVILSVLMMVSLPLYREQVQRTYRALARVELQKVVVRQEQFFIEQRAYASNLEELGYAGESYVLARDGDVRTEPHGGIYRISMMPLGSSFRVSAAPLQGDPRCGRLSLDGLGIRGATGSAGLAGCW